MCQRDKNYIGQTLDNFCFVISKFSDPLLTQNPKKAGRAEWKQRKIRRANGGKKHKSEPKRLRFALETTYGPEGRGFESDEDLREMAKEELSDAKRRLASVTVTL